MHRLLQIRLSPKNIVWNTNTFNFIVELTFLLPHEKYSFFHIYLL